MYKKVIYTAFFLFVCLFGNAQTSTVAIAVVKYNGGGDWYSNPTALPNLMKFCNKEINTIISKVDDVEVGSSDLFKYPFVHLTGHGNVIFSDYEVKNLRLYLVSGGFLHIDDNYGLDTYIRREMKKVFPELSFIELPKNHPIFQKPYSFPSGLPKIHEHDGKPAKAFALQYEGRIICLYTYECDLGDGWEDSEVHNDSNETRLKALKMGANIISYVFSH